MTVSRASIFGMSKLFAVAFLITMLLFPSITHAYTVSHTLCKYVDKSKLPYEPINPTKTFDDTDELVCLLVILKNVRSSRKIYTKWFTPQGDLFTRAIESEWPYDEVDPRSEGYEYFESYSISFNLDLQEGDSNARNFPGQWRVEFYVDDELQFTDSFELKSTAPATTAATTTMQATTPVVTITSILTETKVATSMFTFTTTVTEAQQITVSTFITNPLGIIVIVLIITVLALLVALTRKRKAPLSHQVKPSNIYCMKCGNPIVPGSTFCGKCGKPLN